VLICTLAEFMGDNGMDKLPSPLEELHLIREQLLAESGGTLAGLVARLQKEQEASGRIVRKITRRGDHPLASERPVADPVPVVECR
jgi:hypothetical protein